MSKRWSRWQCPDIHNMRRTNTLILGDLEQDLRRLGNWQAIDAQADVAVHYLPLHGRHWWQR